MNQQKQEKKQEQEKRTPYRAKIVGECDVSFDANAQKGRFRSAVQVLLPEGTDVMVVLESSCSRLVEVKVGGIAMRFELPKSSVSE